MIKAKHNDGFASRQIAGFGIDKSDEEPSEEERILNQPQRHKKNRRSSSGEPQVTIDGVSGVALEPLDGSGGALMWQKDGVIYMLSTQGSTAELPNLADSLR